eukprot:scaffold1889_cov333-Pavlova_lutheri.AAC.8
MHTTGPGDPPSANGLGGGFDRIERKISMGIGTFDSRTRGGEPTTGWDSPAKRARLKFCVLPATQRAKRRTLKGG